MWRARCERSCFGVLALVALLAPASLSAQSHELLGEGDQLRISVYQNPDLTTETRVSERGTITFPLIGAVIVGGLTPAAAEARIAKQLSDGKFVVRPQVSLTVLQLRSRQVSVLGQVGRPGRYALDVHSTLTDILALAGGITPTGDDNVVVVLTRDGKTTRTAVDVGSMYRTGDMTHNVALENGDAVYVERAPQFYIYGEVQRAGAYRVEPGMTVMQALSVGGGPTPRGSVHGIRIHRKYVDGRAKDFTAHLTDLVQSEDVIRVRASIF